MKLLSKIW